MQSEVPKYGDNSSYLGGPWCPPHGENEDMDEVHFETDEDGKFEDTNGDERTFEEKNKSVDDNV